jgi:hypothetical protein
MLPLHWVALESGTGQHASAAGLRKESDTRMVMINLLIRLNRVNRGGSAGQSDHSGAVKTLTWQRQSIFRRVSDPDRSFFPSLAMVFFVISSMLCELVDLSLARCVELQAWDDEAEPGLRRLFDNTIVSIDHLHLYGLGCGTIEQRGCLPLILQRLCRDEQPPGSQAFWRLRLLYGVAFWSDAAGYFILYRPDMTSASCWVPLRSSS